jgi:hypothetical protein
VTRLLLLVLAIGAIVATVAGTLNPMLDLATILESR